MHVDVFVGEIFRCHRELLAIGEIHHGLGKLRRADYIIIARRAHRIEAQAGEHIPGGHLAAVVVAAKRARLAAVLGLDDLVQFLRRLPWLPGIAIQVDDVVSRFVAVPIFTDAAAQIIRG